MPLITSGFHGSSPGMTYEFYAEQTGGSGTKRTIKCTLKLKAGAYSSSHYGYAVRHRFKVNGVDSAWYDTKGNTTWYGSQGFRSFEFTTTTDVKTTAATNITVGFETDTVSYTHWDLVKTGSLAVSRTNVAPGWPSGAALTLRETNSTGVFINDKASGTENQVKIRENISSIYIEWPYAGDADGDVQTYEVWSEINNKPYVKIGEVKHPGKSIIHNIGTGNEGYTYDYYVLAKDPYGAYTPTKCEGTQFQKNSFTPYTLKTTGSINQNSESIKLTFSGAKNTTGSTVFTKSLSASVKVYNSSLIKETSEVDVVIYKSGTLPTSCYVKYDEIKAFLVNSSYKGNITFTLSTKNAYDTTKTSSVNVVVDLQSNPPAPASVTTNTTASSAYKTVKTGSSDTVSNVWIADGSNNIRISWSSVVGTLGEPVRYDVYWTKDAGKTWNTLVNGLVNTVYDHIPPAMSEATTVTYRVAARSTINTSKVSVKDAPSITIYNYKAPTLKAGNVTRAAFNVTIPVTITYNTNIPNTYVTGMVRVYKKGTTTPVGSTVSISSTTTKTCIVSGLEEKGVYDLKITYNDRTGLTSDKTHTISVGALLPLVDISKYGLGAGGIAADSNSVIKAAGLVTSCGGDQDKGTLSMGFNPTTKLATIRYGGEGSSSTGGLVIAGSGDSIKAKIADNGELYATSKLYKVSHSANSVQSYSDSSDYYGMQGPGGSAAWLRIPSTGLLPYSNGVGRLGTSTWRMEDVQTNKLNGYAIGVNQSNARTAIPCISENSVMEVGAVVDFHIPGQERDYEFRLQCTEQHVLAFSGYPKVANCVFRGWGLTADNTMYLGMSVSGSTKYVGMYNTSHVGIQSTGEYSGGTAYIGSSTCRFKTIYLVSAPSVSSDRRYKEEIEDLDNISELFYNLRPRSWVRIDGDTGRRHYGFVAQEVEEAMNKSGVGYKDFAFLQKGPVDEEGQWIDPESIECYDTDERIKDYEYSLAYEEMIAVNTHMIQELKKENDALKDELSEIKELLKQVLKGGDIIDQSTDKQDEERDDVDNK